MSLATASSAMRRALALSGEPSTYSQPACCGATVSFTASNSPEAVSTAVARKPGPTRVIDCSIRDPSLDAKTFHSASDCTQDSAYLIPGTVFASSQSERRKAAFSSMGTVNGSRSSGERHASVTTGVGASSKGRSLARAFAFAAATARVAASSAAAPSTRDAAAKPQAPPASTRTPIP